MLVHAHVARHVRHLEDVLEALVVTDEKAQAGQNVLKCPILLEKFTPVWYCDLLRTVLLLESIERPAREVLYHKTRTVDRTIWPRGAPDHAVLIPDHTA